jgi:MoaA/NifB/PqqE/SkfB family radical SAM enzyme
MRLFNTISIEIASLCNRKCKFCPVAYNTRPKEKMAEETLTEAIRQLGELKYNGRIEWYIYNEPCMEMEWLKYVSGLARELVPRATQMIATNGDYFRNGGDDLLSLYEYGIQQVLVNCYTKGLYERRKPWIEQARRAGIEVDGAVYSALPRNKRTVQMLDKSNPETFGSGIFSITNRAGNITEFVPVVQEPISRMCVRPFRVLNINWMGEAMVCCNDYHADVPVGSFPQQSLTEIWNGPIMNTYREHLLQKDRSLPLCKSCDCHSGAYPNNVDKPANNFADDASIHALYEHRIALRNKP